MEETITALWNGEIAPCEHCGAHDTESNRLFASMEQCQDALRRELETEQLALFEKYIDCSQRFLFRSMALAFQEGFCLGSRLTMESLL